MKSARIVFAAVAVCGCTSEVAANDDTCFANNGDACGRKGKAGRALLQTLATTADETRSPSMNLLENVFRDGKGVPSFLQMKGAAKSSHTSSKHQSVTEAPSAYVVEDAVEQELPAGRLGAHIMKTLIPAALETKTAMQDEIQNEIRRLASCNELAWGTKAAVAHKAKILQEDEAKRYADIADEHRLHVEARDKCAKVDEFIATTADEEPAGFDDVEKTVPAVLEMMKENMEFFSARYPMLGPLDTACKEAKTLAKQKEDNSEVDLQVANEFYCKMKAGRDNACAQYSACFQQKSANYAKVLATVKDMEQHNKDHLKKLSCAQYVDETGVLQNSECDMGSVDTTYLDVSYPANPTPITCPHLVKTSRDYTGIECDLNGNIVTTTTTVQAATTVAPPVVAGTTVAPAVEAANTVTAGPA